MRLIPLLREKGAIPFRDFMQAALYDPDDGYYSRKHEIFGKTGDFYTSPGVHSVFGQTVARDLFKKWHLLDCPSPFILVEFGAGQGVLAKDILTAWKQIAPEIPIHYRIVETSAGLREIQRALLDPVIRATNAVVEWFSDLSEAGSFIGMVLSNELLDAFPVHVVEKTETGWQEIYVTERDGMLAECTGPLSDNRIAFYIDRFLPPLPVGRRAEVNLAALDWLQEISIFLKKGFIITIDYGEESDHLYEGRNSGTIRAFYRHQPVSELYVRIGQQDITSDVNFTAIRKYGEDIGLGTFLYGTQANYLVQAGILETIAPPQSDDPFQDETFKRNLAIKHLILPGGMGDRFKVLIQQKSG
ncbi:class I SAM-dependent methyltransferase [Effusibacillus dendaii]|uniref:SAM-dependent methyltransferase n=1 Tax=Effusibacillus dendaii TaxID=2743772 RepID=A0A7I8DBG1_9BACL|nr:SAM-dependent methyltransferase [Effusibacillus dendaii]BCJ86176.1 SAM-dependent methyltransferase [Effusibacillus dendaii]